MNISGKSTLSGSLVASATTLSLVLGNAIPAVAASLTLNSVTGRWTNPNVNQVYTKGVDTNEIRWGWAAESQQSGFRFNGATNTSVSFEKETSVLLGKFTHFNFPTYSGTGIDAVDLDITLDIEGSTKSLFKYTFGLEETINTFFLDECPAFQVSNTPCDDRITFASKSQDTTFSVGGKELTLQLLGFSSTPDAFNPISSLITQERAATGAYLVGRIKPLVILADKKPPVSTPEPGALIGFSLLGLYLFNRRPKFQRS